MRTQGPAGQPEPTVRHLTDDGAPSYLEEGAGHRSGVAHYVSTRQATRFA
jgi:hypothetical protein